MNPARLAELLGDWGYATYVFLLCATGVGSPIPEDLILATAGYLVSAGVFGWPGAIAAGVFGVVASDAMLYGWGRRLRGGAAGGWLSRFVRPDHLARADRWLSRFGPWSVFVARLVPGARAVAFIGAVLRQMPFGHFILRHCRRPHLGAPRARAGRADRRRDRRARSRNRRDWPDGTLGGRRGRAVAGPVDTLESGGVEVLVQDR